MTDTKFTSDDGNVEMSFAKGLSVVGVQYQVAFDGLNTSYRLTLDRSLQWIFKGLNGARLTAISFPSPDWSGGITLYDGNQPGTYTRSLRSWSCSEGTSQVVFGNNLSNAESQFYTVQVTYVVNSVVVAASATPASGSTVESFHAVQLDYGRTISSYSGGIKASNGSDVNVTFSGSVATVTLAEDITTDGTYTIDIPAGCFTFSDGYQNVAMTYVINVVTPKNTFLPTSIQPAEGSYEQLSLPIQLTFGSPFVLSKESGGSLEDDNTKWGALSFAHPHDYVLSVSSGVKTDAFTTTDNNLNVVVTIPEGTVTAVDGTYNPEIVLNYTITPTTTPTPTPTPDPDDPDVVENSETMKLAIQLIGQRGLGYPTTGSTAYVALRSLVNTYDGKTTSANKDEVDYLLKAAIGNYYNEEQVQMPAANNTYKIYAVNADGTKAYLSYNSDAVTLTTDESSAENFTAEAHNGLLAFATSDGNHYLRLLNNSNNYDDGKTTSNVTSSYSAVNDLTIAKLKVAGADSTQTFGKFSVYGSLGTNLDTNAEEKGYARVRFGASPSVGSPASAPDFNSNASSAFLFEQTGTVVVKPDITLVLGGFTIDPETVKPTDTFILTLTNMTKDVKRNSKVNASFLDEAGNVVNSEVGITPLSGSENQFVIEHADLANGTYTLVLPDSLFYTVLDDNGNVNMTSRWTLTFTVTGSAVDNTSFKYIEVTPRYNLASNINDTDLNNLIIYYQANEVDSLVPDASKTVSIIRQSDNTVVATGHLEQTTYDVGNGNSYYALKLVLDSPIAAGDIESGVYTVSVDEATYGDKNFGKKLTDPTSVLNSDCRVNGAFTAIFIVTASTATGIDNAGVVTVKSVSSDIFDLQGRRVEKITRPGIYIVNGKKVVSK